MPDQRIYIAPAGSDNFQEMPLVEGGFTGAEFVSAAADVEEHREVRRLNAAGSVTTKFTARGSGLSALFDDLHRDHVAKVAADRGISTLDAERLIALQERRYLARQSPVTPNRATRRKQEREAGRARRG